MQKLYKSQISGSKSTWWNMAKSIHLCPVNGSFHSTAAALAPTETISLQKLRYFLPGPLWEMPFYPWSIVLHC